jgi:hypothetical protein
MLLFEVPDVPALLGVCEVLFAGRVAVFALLDAPGGA